MESMPGRLAAETAACGATASAPSVIVVAYTVAVAVAAGKGEFAEPGLELDSIFGSEIKLPPVEPKGERGGAAAGADEAAERAGLAAGRGVDADAGVAGRAALTPLNSSSIGKRRC